MKKIFGFFFLAVVLIIVYSPDVIAHGKKAKALPHFKEGVTKISENGLFSIEIVLEPIKPIIGKNKVNVYLHDADGKDLENAKVELEVYNKDKGIVSPEKPKTKETEKGEYIIRNVVYDSTGIYEIRVKVSKGSESDKAVFEVEVK